MPHANHDEEPGAKGNEPVEDYRRNIEMGGSNYHVTVCWLLRLIDMYDMHQNRDI